MSWLTNLWPNKIKYQLIAGVAIVHAILMSIFVYDLVTRERAFLLDHIEQQATSLSQTVSTNALPWVLSNNLSGLSEIVTAQKQFPNLSYVLITNPEGKVLAHSDSVFVGKFLVDDISQRMLRSPTAKISLIRSGNTIDVAHQVKLDQRTVGWVRVGLSTKSLNDNIENIMWEGLFYTLFAIVIGSIIAWFLGNNLTQRIRKVIDATKEVDPETQSKIFDDKKADEVSELMTNFNQMEYKLHQQFKEIQTMAYQDALTGLAGRAYFETAFAESTQICTEADKVAAMVIIDIDNFKQLNDSYGHDVGDHLLVETAERLQEFIKPQDFAFRFGGDEFVLILNKFNASTSQGVIESLVNQLLMFISKPCHLGEVIYNPQFSIGLYQFDQQAVQQEAFKKADIALYTAKRLGKGQVTFFLPEMEKEIQLRSQYDSGLKNALQNQELFWMIQPQMDMNTNQVIGGEVLLRWKHQDELVRPDVFIPIAEDNQTIIPISNWLIKQVFEFIQDNNLNHLSVSINLSPVHFFDLTLIVFLKGLLKRYQVSPYSIKFEVTEGVFLERMEEAVAIINKLKTIGFNISLDDFGTGFSSLSYLKNLPIDQLKIDKSFIDGLPDNEKPVAIAKTIIDLTRNLELNVIAEGVETKAQKEFLLANNCLYCQGFYFSKPLSPQEFLTFEYQEKAIADNKVIKLDAYE